MSLQLPKKKPTWYFLLAPMLLASIGLHALILFVPTGPAEEDLLPPPDPEEDGVAVIKIDAPQARTATNAGATNAASATSAQASRAASSTTAGRRPVAQRSGNRSTDTNAQGSTGDIPNLGNTPGVSNPNQGTPSVGGQATSGIGSTTGDRTNNVAASTGPESFEEYIEVFESYNPIKVSTADAAETRNIWLNSFSDRGPEFTNIEIEPLKIFDPLPYEANICLPGTPEAAQLLVLVDAEGNLEEGQYQPFLQRTGYRSFDNAAAEKIKQHDFPEADMPRAFLVEIAVDYKENDCDWPPQVEKLPDEYFTVLENYTGPTLTRSTDSKAAQENWLASLADNEEIDLPAMDELAAADFEDFEDKVPYPLNICLPLAPKAAKFGVVVQPDGTLGTEPVFVRSTGYQNFDDRARELVTNFAYPTADNTRLLIVEVPVDYNGDNCQSLDSDAFEVPTTTTRVNNDAADTTSTTSPSTEEGAAIAFDPDQQASLLEAGRQQVEANPADGLRITAASLAIEWPEDIDQSCFLADITADNFVPVDSAADAIILSANSENAEFAPLRLSRLYQVESSDAGEYCDAPLLQLSLNGTPQLFASMIPFGNGGAHNLVIFWTTDPRET
ncbi:MAG: hypothetical protein AAGD09_10390 [Cyanobacteria bacterium P01_F01_bin.56]